MTTKAELRTAARARRARLAADLPDFAQAIAGFAAALGLERGAVVSSYWPFGSEADPRLLSQALGARGHRIALPCVVGAGKPLVFRHGEALAAHKFGFHEPVAEAPAIVPSVLLVPLLAFDGEGYRLGYGGGYYDRTLAELRSLRPVLAIGVAFSGQEHAALPHESYDQRLDMVLTEKGIRRYHSPGTSR